MKLMLSPKRMMCLEKASERLGKSRQQVVYDLIDKYCGPDVKE